MQWALNTISQQHVQVQLLSTHISTWHPHLSIPSSANPEEPERWGSTSLIPGVGSSGQGDITPWCGWDVSSWRLQVRHQFCCMHMPSPHLSLLSPPQMMSKMNVFKSWRKTYNKFSRRAQTYSKKRCTNARLDGCFFSLSKYLNFVHPMMTVSYFVRRFWPTPLSSLQDISSSGICG